MLLYLLSATAYSTTSALAKQHKSSAKCPPLQQSPEEGKRFSGNISWYGVPFHGRKTASGRIFDMNKLTAAHKTLPFGTKILIENPKTGKACVVEIIDRGPYSGNRIIDVSRESARKLGILPGGLAFVNCLIVGRDGQSKHEDNGQSADSENSQPDATPQKNNGGGSIQGSPESSVDR